MDTNTSPNTCSGVNLYEVVMVHLRAKRIPQREVAEGSGVPYSTVTKIAQGQTESPSVHHIQALYDFFIKHDPVFRPRECGKVGCV